MPNRRLALTVQMLVCAMLTCLPRVVHSDIVVAAFDGQATNGTTSTILTDGDEFEYEFQIDREKIIENGTSQLGNIFQHSVIVNEFEFTSLLEDVNNDVIFASEYFGQVLIRITDTDITTDGALSISMDFVTDVVLLDSNFDTPEEFFQDMSFTQDIGVNLNPAIGSVESFNEIVDIWVDGMADPDAFLLQTQIIITGDTQRSGFGTYSPTSAVFSVVPEPCYSTLLFALGIASTCVRRKLRA